MDKNDNLRNTKIVGFAIGILIFVGVLKNSIGFVDGLKFGHMEDYAYFFFLFILPALSISLFAMLDYLKKYWISNP